jgi:hypothetical protein
LYPSNAVTAIIYVSKDVGGAYKHHRVPSSFLSAHSYGATMLFSLPLLLNSLVGVKVPFSERSISGAGAVAAAGGLLMCGARTPLILLGLTLVLAWALTRFSLKFGVVVAVLVGAGLIVASADERFQRLTTLQDSEVVSRRIATSMNEGFWELMIQYPFGAGMGTATGTSIPFFLADQAPEQIGMENEYSRILIDQGWFGLAGWWGLLAWLFARPPWLRPRTPWWLGVILMYSLTLTSWASAFSGTGTLTSIPGTFLMMTQMGVLIAVRRWGAVPEAAVTPAEDSADLEVEAEQDAVPDDGSGADGNLHSWVNRQGHRRPHAARGILFR